LEHSEDDDERNFADHEVQLAHNEQIQSGSDFVQSEMHDIFRVVCLIFNYLDKINAMLKIKKLQLDTIVTDL